MCTPSLWSLLIETLRDIGREEDIEVNMTGGGGETRHPLEGHN